MFLCTSLELVACVGDVETAFLPLFQRPGSPPVLALSGNHIDVPSYAPFFGPYAPGEGEALREAKNYVDRTRATIVSGVVQSSSLVLCS